MLDFYPVVGQEIPAGIAVDHQRLVGFLKSFFFHGRWQAGVEMADTAPFAATQSILPLMGHRHDLRLPLPDQGADILLDLVVITQDTGVMNRIVPFRQRSPAVESRCQVVVHRSSLQRGIGTENIRATWAQGDNLFYAVILQPFYFSGKSGFEKMLPAKIMGDLQATIENDADRFPQLLFQESMKLFDGSRIFPNGSTAGEQDSPGSRRDSVGGKQPGIDHLFVAQQTLVSFQRSLVSLYSLPALVKKIILNRDVGRADALTSAAQ